MAAFFNLPHLTFSRVLELLSSSNGPLSIDSEEEYIRTLPRVREQFLAHEVEGFDLDRSLQDDYGTLATYRGYLKFLEADLEASDIMKGPDGKPLSNRQQGNIRRTIARQMLSHGAVCSGICTH